jgi:hypothetical protein
MAGRLRSGVLRGKSASFSIASKMPFEIPEHFQAKWTPVRVKKMRQNKNINPRSDSIGTEKALEVPQ